MSRKKLSNIEEREMSTLPEAPSPTNVPSPVEANDSTEAIGPTTPKAAGNGHPVIGNDIGHHEKANGSAKENNGAPHPTSTEEEGGN